MRDKVNDKTKQIKKTKTEIILKVTSEGLRERTKEGGVK